MPDYAFKWQAFNYVSQQETELDGAWTWYQLDHTESLSCGRREQPRAHVLPEAPDALYWGLGKQKLTSLIWGKHLWEMFLCSNWDAFQTEIQWINTARGGKKLNWLIEWLSASVPWKKDQGRTTCMYELNHDVTTLRGVFSACALCDPILGLSGCTGRSRPKVCSSCCITPDWTIHSASSLAHRPRPVRGFNDAVGPVA